MVSNNVIIIGSSGHAKVIIDIIESLENLTIVGLIDDFRRKNSEKTLDYKVLGGIADLPKLMEVYKVKKCVIAIGDNYNRKKISEKIADFDLEFINVIHPQALISPSVRLGYGNVIMPGVIINSSVKLGNFNILNTHATIEHDVSMGNFSSVGPKAVLAGGVHIGNETAIGMNTAVIEKVTIGNYNVIGACSLVNKDLGDNSVSYGIPSKIKKSRERNDTYLR
ncbi:acetyltransferase [Flavobacteriaceae bacterium F08102]|nr:acetyltransferase [Flavobacteriaceae bacterium F08102]